MNLADSRTFQATHNLGYKVSVNLFTEDKSATTEATDWSYWKSGEESSSNDSIVSVNFISSLLRENIGFTIIIESYS
ncbi:hypothetical protein A2V71_00810 [Candidatus Berkelbacteria bacterium RBG_13_40_8]|uniref:Uncharacterized protein n=1 Tax=Candidatus Berkelbacteria bacterium RBG_13_40_8 TaxID=1797467 RepID=A0A1F5DQL4_9BACT|nr:MAG: hypothetical protein A2V71_00810 [Candidatus Berkelbacteria bacterium RBG_13_40_8]